MIADLVHNNRSIRRFSQEVSMDLDTLKALVDLARLSPSGRNLQPLKYKLVCTPENCAQVFPLLGWAGYLPDWPGPAEGERPSAYIIILGDRTISQSFNTDAGLALQSILLGAVERGLGGCIIGTVQRETLADLFKIPDHLEIIYVLALGTPAETVLVEPMPDSGDVRYWRSQDQVHHVPKRSLDEIILP